MNELKTNKNTAQTDSDWGSPRHVHTLVLMAITVSGIYLCYRLAAPFFPALAWALALAVLFAPCQRWLESTVKRPTIAATLCVLMVGLIVVVPMAWVAEQIISETAKGVDTIKARVESGEWRRSFEANSFIAPVFHWVDQQFDLPGLIKAAAAWLTTTLTAFVRGSALQVIGFVITFYMLFYFLRDRGAALESLRSLLPLSRIDINRLFDDVNDTIHATVYGTLAVAVVQGALGGLMFWLLDLSTPLLWGIVMALLAVIPVLGAFIVWIPAALFLLLDGSGGKALLLTLWGAIVVGGIDNLLYPLLVGKRLKINTLIAFISLVGGLIFFGAAGLILGPVAYTVTRSLLDIWSQRNAAASPVLQDITDPQPPRE